MKYGMTASRIAIIEGFGRIEPVENLELVDHVHADTEQHDARDRHQTFTQAPVGSVGSRKAVQKNDLCPSRTSLMPS